MADQKLCAACCATTTNADLSTGYGRGKPRPTKNSSQLSEEGTSLPAAGGEQVLLFELANIDAAHGFAKFLVSFENRFRIFEVRCGLHDGLGTSIGVAGFEDARAHEDGFRAEPANKCSVCRRSDTTCGEIWHRQFSSFRYLADDVERRAHFLGLMHEFIIAKGGELTHVADDGAHVADCFDNVAGARLALGAYHRGAFCDAANRFAEIARAANERDTVVMLPDV